MTAPDPPKAAEQLVRALIGGPDGDAAAGDLREEFHARGGGALWYWTQALSCIAVRLSPFRRGLPDLSRDFHYALRTVRRNPGYATAAMLCLALGIGVNTSIFSLIDELFFRPLPVPEPARVVRFSKERNESFLWQDTVELRKRNGSFANLAAYSAGMTGIEVNGVAQVAMAEWISADYDDALRLPAHRGRWFTPADEARGAEPAAVISHRLWTRYYGQDPGIIGKTIRIETEYYRIAGVAPAGFSGVFPPHDCSVWIPYTVFPPFRKRLEAGATTRASLIGRLRPGVSIAAARNEADALDTRIRHDFPRPQDPNRPDHIPFTLTTASGAVPQAQRMMLPFAALMLLVVGAVLLIACVNVANLLLARASVRRHEMDVRRALGASRWRLVRQSLAESAVLAAGGAGLGLLLGGWANHTLGLMLPAMPKALNVALHLDLNWRVAAITAAVSLGAALLFGLSPALEQTRATISHTRQSRRRDALVVVQVAVSLLLLITAGLFLRALSSAENLDPGFATGQRLTARLYISPPEYTEESGRVFYQRLLDEVTAAPGVRGAALSYSLPFSFNGGACLSANRTAEPRRAGASTIAGDYFRVMKIPIESGRAFGPQDTAASERAIVVNQTLARRYFPGEDVIGKAVWLGCNDGDRQPARVVGVARDSKYSAVGEAAEPYLYRPHSQDWTGLMVLFVHTPGEPDGFIPTLNGILTRLDPKLRMLETLPLAEHVSRSLWQVRWEASMLAAFGFLAIVLGAIGLYGVVAYAVAQRTREIGIRMAMGARREDVVWMVLARGLRLTAIGIAAGLALAAAITRFLRSFLYGVSPMDPLTFAAAALFWIAVAMLASYVPARRAARVEPVVALRYE
ncbi:MAG: ABC transporter permease [Bryobacteraceae bacterium]